MRGKMLILANSSSGLYSFRRELIGEILAGNDVIASTPDRGNIWDLEAIGCNVLLTDIDRRGINPVTDLKLMLNYWKMLRREKPDLVITYTIKPNVYGGMVCRLLGIPYAANITGLGTAFQKQGALRTLVTILYKTALKKAKVIFFENAENMQVLLDERIARNAQCCLLNGAGVNTEYYAYTTYPEAEGTTRFLFVGRVMREKGVDELFTAMSRLQENGFDCVLDVVGGFEENYAEKIAAHTEQGWLRYHGYQKDVRPYIEKAHCLVLPSYHEGMANTNLECAAMGRPVITSNIHGCKEAVEDGVSGLLCEMQNTDSLYDAMVRFVKLSGEERAAMGCVGRTRMEEIFDKKKVVAATLKALGL